MEFGDAGRGMIPGIPDTAALVQLAGITLIAAAVQGAVGFGFTLLAVSFFLLILQSGEAVQLLLVVNLTISVALVGRLWQGVDRALWGRLVLGSFLGFPLAYSVFLKVATLATSNRPNIR